jgi:hypothetical protein
VKKARTKGPAKSRAPSGRKGPQTVTVGLKSPADVRALVDQIKADPELHGKIWYLHRKWHQRSAELPVGAPLSREDTDLYLTFLVHTAAWTEARAERGERREYDARNLAAARQNLLQSIVKDDLGVAGAAFSIIIDAQVRLVREAVLQ